MRNFAAQSGKINNTKIYTKWKEHFSHTIAAAWTNMGSASAWQPRMVVVYWQLAVQKDVRNWPLATSITGNNWTWVQSSIGVKDKRLWEIPLPLIDFLSYFEEFHRIWRIFGDCCWISATWSPEKERMLWKMLEQWQKSASFFCRSMKKL